MKFPVCTPQIISKTLFIHFLCCLSLVARGQDTFKLINPVIPLVYPEFLHAFSGNDIVALAENGFGIQTATGGKTWQVQDFKRGSPALTSHFPGKGVGFFTTLKMSPLEPGGLIWKTIDSGKTWNKKIWPMNFHRLSFCDSANGMGIDLLGNQLYRTTNGGDNWSLVSTLPPPDPLITNILCEVHQVSPSVVLLRIEHHLFRSIDAGQTWTEIQTGVPEMVHSSNSPVTQAIYKGFGQTYFLQYRAGIDFWRSDDGGLNWNRLTGSNPMPATGWATKSFRFNSSASGWTTAWNSPFLYHTADSGKTWILRYNAVLNDPDKTVASVDALGDSLVIIGLNDGNLLCSRNQGQSWKSIIQGENIGASYNKAVFPTANSVFLSGWFKRQGITWFNRLSQTRWTTRIDPTFHPIDIQHLSPTVGYRISASQIQRTTTGGIRWKNLPVPNTGSFISREALHFFNIDSGLVFSSKQIFRTRDSGNTWQLVMDVNNGMKNLSFFQFVNSQVGFALLDTSTGSQRTYCLIKTEDAGQTWNILPTGLTGNRSVFGFSAHDEQNIWIDYNSELSPGPRGILQSTNGGLSWAYKNTSFSGNRCLKFVSPTRGYVLKDWEGLYETQDAGQTWQLVDSAMRFSMFQNYSLVVRNGKPAFILANGIYTTLGFGNEFHPTISGTVALNQNNDCVLDSQEIRLPNRLVVIEPGTYYTSTDSLGSYGLDLENGTYSASQILPNFPGLPESQACPPNNASHVLEIGGLFGDTITVPPFLNNAVLCPKLELSSHHFFARPCRVSTFFVEILNNGNQSSEPTEIHLQFPSALHVLTSNPPLTFSPSDSTWRFTVPILYPAESFSIQIRDSVACNPAVLLGQLLCVKAIIKNVPPCLLQSSNWDGADLEVASRCVANQTRFTLHNKGASMPSTSQYQIFIDSALVYQAPFQLAANGSMTITLPANAPAGFVRLRVPQSPNHPLSTFASAEANCATGLSSNGMFPPPDESPLVDIECVTVTNSVDPNDKTVYPTGWGTAGNVEPETEFKYTIRFQNTGTDTAFKVVLVDTLDAGLDIASLQIGSASHPFEFKVSGKGRPVFTWTFSNILLPDSNTNEAESHGFVSFSIRPKTGLALGTRLENFADIYFDFNDPVRTNTTVNTLWRPTLTEGILDTVFVTASKKSISVAGISVYPNPTKGKFELNSSQKGTLRIFNLQGQLVNTQFMAEGKNQIDLSSLPKGLYLLKLEIETETLAQKLVLE